MGLDMYLRGRKHFWTNYENPKEDRKEDGLTVEMIEVELGYWRKHPNLHGFIVKTFAGGEDNCEEVNLTPESLRTIIETVKMKALPTTTGFFFGSSDGSKEELDEDVKILTRALEWLEAGDIKPVSVGEPVQLGMGMAMMEIKPTQEKTAGVPGAPPPKKEQNVTREVYYRASW